MRLPADDCRPRRRLSCPGRRDSRDGREHSVPDAVNASFATGSGSCNDNAGAGLNGTLARKSLPGLRKYPAMPG